LGEFLATTPGLKALVTSRVALHLHDEHEFPVPPLTLPDNLETRKATATDLASYGAVELFVLRAQSVDPGFRLTDENAPTVAEICARLDGLPLAIELAAARSKLLSPAAILNRLHQQFTLLTGGSRDLPPRHQTMRQTIAWSYDLLEPSQQALFRRVCVFASGFTLASASTVCGAGDDDQSVVDGLSALLDQSLIRRIDPADAEGRLMVLNTMRAFGLEQLEAAGESAEYRDRHARHMLALLEEAKIGLRGPLQAEWLGRLNRDLDNIRAAIAWFLENRD
jgi:predicted ATPase